jgi:hypothetical protein
MRIGLRTRRGMALGRVLVLASISSACLQPSLNPLLLPADTTFDARLLGAWKSGDTAWTFGKVTDTDALKLFGERPFYEVAITEKNETVKLWAWMGRLGGGVFINFFPDDPPVEIKSGFYKRHMVAAHTFGRIWIEADHVRLRTLDSDWVEKAVKAGGFSLGQRRWPDDAVLLTASTTQLQRFARQHADDAKAFGDRIDLTRGGAQ